MRAEPVTPEVVAASLRERRDWNAGRVGADDRSGPPRGIDLLEQRPLDVQPLDDRLDDPVRLGDAWQTSVEAGGGDQRPGVRRKEGIRLERSCALQSLRRGFRRDVQQQGRNARVGEMGGDLRPHDTRTKYRDRPDHGSSLSALPRVGPRRLRGRCNEADDGRCEAADPVGASLWRRSVRGVWRRLAQWPVAAPSCSVALVFPQQHQQQTGCLNGFQCMWMAAGIRTIVPGVARTAVPPIVSVHAPSRTTTSASNGDVCSVSPCPTSNAKSVRLAPDVLPRTRLAIPSGVGTISSLKRSACPGGII
jgi:hypothetical protein